MTLLEDVLLRPLPIGQVNLKSYLPQTRHFEPWYIIQYIYYILMRGGLGAHSIPIKGGGGGMGINRTFFFILKSEITFVIWACSHI